MGVPLTLITEAELHRIFSDTLGGNAGLDLLKGFNLNLSANKDFHKVFFAARCECGTSALLSVAVDKSKTVAEVGDVAPRLMEQLRVREQAFRDMSCEIHAKMRTGGAIQASKD